MKWFKCWTIYLLTGVPVIMLLAMNNVEMHPLMAPSFCAGYFLFLINVIKE